MSRFRFPALAAALLAVAGCAPGGGPSEAPGIDPAPSTAADAPPAEPADAEGSLWISPAQVPPGADLAVAIVASTGADLFGGVGASVSRWDGTAWREYGFAGLCVAGWQCAGAITTEGEMAVNDIGVSAGSVMRLSTAGLDLGWYRLSMGLFDNAETPGHRRDIPAAGQFKVSADAPEPAPLWGLEGVHYSVVPGLLPGGGGEVAVWPVVPSNPDGSLSAEDIEAAVAGQSTTAAIEEWADGAWRSVGEVPLTPLAEGGTTDNTALIPRLPPGAYRLVRTGPQGELTGSFWIQGPAPGYASPQVRSVTMTDLPAGDVGTACDGWTVDVASSQAWHAAVACVTDPDRLFDPPDLTPVDPVPLTPQQVTTFAHLIDDVGLGTWSYLLATGQLPAHPTGGWRTIVQVGLTDGTWDSFAVAGAEPPGWQTFVDELRALTG